MSTLDIDGDEVVGDRITSAVAHTSASATLIYGYVLYQQRLTMIAARYPGSFDQLVGPLLICASLFIVILANFIFRLVEAREAHEPHGDDANPLSFAYAWRVAGEKSTWLN